LKPANGENVGQKRSFKQKSPPSYVAAPILWLAEPLGARISALGVIIGISQAKGLLNRRLRPYPSP